jgi:hypothetical protein
MSNSLLVNLAWPSDALTPFRVRGGTPSPALVPLHIVYMGDELCPLPMEDCEFALMPDGDGIRMRITLPMGYLPPPPAEAFLIPRHAPRQAMTLSHRDNRFVLECERVEPDEFYSLVLL